MKRSIVIIAALAVAGAVSIAMYAQDGPEFGAMSEQEGVRHVVFEAVARYDAEGAGFVDMITEAGTPGGGTYLFVIDAESRTVVAHGSNPDRVGSVSVALTGADRPAGQILEDLRREGGTWTEYVFENPATGEEQTKTSWLVMRDGLVFGAGYYS